MTDGLLAHIAVAMARDEALHEHFVGAQDEIPGARVDDGLPTLLTRLILDSKPLDVHLMAIAHEAEAEDDRAERRRGRVAYGVDRHPIAEVVAGLRLLAKKVEQMEVEAARNARARGVTGRQLADATGLSERQVTNRYGPARARNIGVADSRTAELKGQGSS